MFGHTCDRDRFAEFLPQLFASSNYYSYLCPIKIKDMEDKSYAKSAQELREALRYNQKPHCIKTSVSKMDRRRS